MCNRRHRDVIINVIIKLYETLLLEIKDDIGPYRLSSGTMLCGDILLQNQQRSSFVSKVRLAIYNENCVLILISKFHFNHAVSFQAFIK